MTLVELRQNVFDNPATKWIGACQGHSWFAYVSANHDTGVYVKLGDDMPSWEVIMSIASGRRDPNPMIHISRIVGYFSVVERWNESKIGEHREREEGYKFQFGSGLCAD